MRRAINGWLREAYRHALAWVIERSGGDVGKDDDSLPSLEPLVEQLEDVLADVIEIGTGHAAAVLGIDLKSPPEAVVRYVRERAAEMVGMKRLPDGSLIPNPNARWQISETLRSQINTLVDRAVKEGLSNDEVAAALRSHFEPWRAETIARTETATAYNQATAEVYDDAGVELMDVFDGEGCLPSGHKDGADAPDGTVGVVQEDRLADGQVWTIEQMRAHLIGHPNCVRSFTPHIGELTAAA